MNGNDKINKSMKVLLSSAIICAFMTGSAFSQQNGKTEPANNQKKEETKKTTDKITSDKAVDGWRISDYKPYITAIKDLEKLSKEYSEFMLKRSIDEYSRGLDTLDDMLTEIERLRTEYKNKKYLNEKWYWQEVDRKNAQERYIQRLKNEAKTKSITNFTKSINNLDKIKSNELKNDPKYIEFKSKLFRVYVSTQFDLGNFKPCLPILERYITLSEETRKDIWAYKYLANCYAFMEETLKKSKSPSEEDIVYYKNMKNKSMLQAVELKHGTDSVEFKELQRIVQLDEKKSESININK